MARRVHLQHGLGKGHGKVVNLLGTKVLVVEEVNLIGDIGEEEGCTFDRGSILCIEVAASCYKQEQTLFNDLRQGIAITNPTGMLKYKVAHLPL